MKNEEWPVDSSQPVRLSSLLSLLGLLSLLQPSGTQWNDHKLFLAATVEFLVVNGFTITKPSAKLSVLSAGSCLHGLWISFQGRQRKERFKCEPALLEKTLTLLSSMMKLPPNKALPKHFHNPVKIQCIILKMIYVYVKFYNSTLLMLGINSL